MTDETVDGQGGTAPATTDNAEASPDLIDFGGKKMSLEDAQRSYSELQKTHTQTAQQRAEYERQVNDLKPRAQSYDQMQNDYTNRQDVRDAIDGAYGASGVQPLSREAMQIQELQVRQARMEQEGKMKDLKEKWDLTPDQEISVLREIEVNPVVQDPEAAFFILFKDEVIKNEREKAGEAVRKQMAENQSTYPKELQGGPGTVSQEDLKNLSQDDLDKKALAALGQLGKFR